MAKRKKKTSKAKTKPKEKKENKKEENFFEWSKSNWHLIILALILLFGFYLRTYHLDYPVIGYHNWKEYHYLTESRNYARDGFFANGFLLPSYSSHNLNLLNEGLHPDTFPTTSIITGIAFKLFGFHLWIARLISVLFVLGAIGYFYLLIEKLLKRKDFALLGALLFAINPLTVFFGRQVQLINPSLFFLVGALYYFVSWLRENKNKQLYLFSAFAMMSFATKYSFFIIFPLVAIMFPYKKVYTHIKEYIKPLLIAASFWLVPVFWFIYNTTFSSDYITKEVSGSNLDIGLVFSDRLWTPMNSYLADNFTHFGLFLMILGIFATILLKNKLAKKFVVAYLISGFVWFVIMAEKLMGHNYHQYPMVPFVLFAMTIFFVILSSLIYSFAKKYVKKDYFIHVPIYLILILLLIYPPFFDTGGGIITAKNRMFDQQFIGVDVGAEYIAQNAAPDDRYFHSSGQSHGSLWHADREGWSFPSDLELVKFGENEHNYNWIFLYQWGLANLQRPEVLQHLQENYEIKQIGLTQNGQSFSMSHLVLKRGGSFVLDDVNTKLQEAVTQNRLQQRQYELTTGTRTYYFVNLD